MNFYLIVNGVVLHFLVLFCCLFISVFVVVSVVDVVGVAFAEGLSVQLNDKCSLLYLSDFIFDLV